MKDKIDNPTAENIESESGVSRRGLLKGAALIGATTGIGLASASANAVTEDSSSSSSDALTADSGSSRSNPRGQVLAEDPATRARRAKAIKNAAAQANFDQSSLDEQEINDDELRFDDFRGNFRKSLQHNALSEVATESYKSFLRALNSRNPQAFENIIVGRPNDPQRNRLVSPQAAFAFELSGKDGNAARIPAAPAVDSLTTQAEMAELYWYSVTRDIPFAEYGERPIIQKAADDLAKFTKSDIFAKDSTGSITPDTLFRGSIPVVGSAEGVLNGPFVSQFLTLPYQQGQLEVEQRYRKVTGGVANQFLTQFFDFLNVQEGFDPNAAAGGNATSFNNGFRYMARMRDLSEWVHRDYPQQAPLTAFSVLLGLGDDLVWDQNLPYLGFASNTQQGFASFGLGDMAQLVTLAPRQALTAAWFQKWSCHRRTRPEEYGGLINVQSRGKKDYGLGVEELLGSKAFEKAVDEVRKVNGNSADQSNDGLLPMGFPEGCPAHPAYPGGHSCFIAAGATVLKAFVNEDYVFVDPKVANNNGSELLSYTASNLTLGGELNKLIANVTHARDGAGMHWRSDGVGNLIGEAVGIATLADYTRTYNERFNGFNLTKLDGTKILIKNGKVSRV